MSRNITIESLAGHGAFRPLSSIDGIAVDLRYNGPNNFVGRNLYAPFDCAWLHQDAAVALALAVAHLARHRPGMRLLILDALRPQRVQEALWTALEGSALQGYLAQPARGSLHSFGMAVDVTIIDALGIELDMGTPFDALCEASHPALETQMLASEQIGAEHVANREMLRAAMGAGGFAGIPSEWWHFNCGNDDLIRRSYCQVL